VSIALATASIEEDRYRDFFKLPRGANDGIGDADEACPRGAWTLPGNAKRDRPIGIHSPTESTNQNGVPIEQDKMDSVKTAEIALIMVYCGESEIERRAFAVKDKVSIGRDSFTDIIIEDATVSRLHVELQRENNELVLYDRSSNGTMVNGKPVARHVVQNGDVLSLGRFKVVIELHADWYLAVDDRELR